jgi:hypothetical protein
MKKIMYGLIGLLIASCCLAADEKGANQRWSVEKASQWYAGQPWLVGANFTPSTAINQLEMWQADTFDPETIDRELGWAEDLGMNFMRVFLHDLLWQQDSEGFLQRVDQFLAIADKHHIKIMFVPLDSVWDPFPKLGQQRAPKPHVHNSGWVQSPHIDLLKDPARHHELEGYIKGLLIRFKQDPRVLLWDLYNEPDNHNNNSYGQFEPKNKKELAVQLLHKLFQWGWEVRPDQPLSVGLWKGSWEEGKLDETTRIAVDCSDVITYHSYGAFKDLKARTELLFTYNRPLICTEYMARPVGSTFMCALPYFKEHRIGACNWGFVAGKTQTQYPWDSWEKKYTAEPPLWFHEILRPDGSPYDENEVEFIKMMTGK